MDFNVFLTGYGITLGVMVVLTLFSVALSWGGNNWGSSIGRYLVFSYVKGESPNPEFEIDTNSLEKALHRARSVCDEESCFIFDVEHKKIKKGD